MPSLFLWKDKKAFTFTVEAFFYEICAPNSRKFASDWNIFLKISKNFRKNQEKTPYPC